jgi:CBS domain-containing protein
VCLILVDTHRKTDKRNKERKSGHPGGGAGKKDKVGPSGVHPMSGPHPRSDAPLVWWPGAWGQGKRGAAGYENHGESGLNLRRVKPGKCRDIMTKDPVFCQASDTATIAAKLMKRHNIGALPVIGNLRGKKLVGIITDRDLAMNVVAEAHDPHTITVDQIMSRPVVTCSPDDRYQKALDLMEQHQVKRIPAVDNSGRVVGMISEADVALRVRDEKKTAEVVMSICQPA